MKENVMNGACSTHGDEDINICTALVCSGRDPVVLQFVRGYQRDDMRRNCC